MKTISKIIISTTFIVATLTGCSEEMDTKLRNTGKKLEEKFNVANYVTINGVEINTLDENEYNNLIKTKEEELSQKNIQITVGDNEYTLTPADISEHYDEEKAKKDISEDKENITLEIIYDANKLDSFINKIEKETKENFKEASMTIEGTKSNGEPNFVFKEGHVGKTLDKVALKKDLNDAILNGTPNVTGIVENKEPTLTVEKLKEATSLLGTGKSSYATSSEDRNKNLEVATKKINYSIVEPGEVFSTNETYGPITLENGFKISKVISEGELIDGVGGGVCQVSSTLYNAVIRAELDVVERRNHSLKVGYYDYAFDAAVSQGSLDFRFKNTTDTPIVIQSYLDKSNKNVIAKIYGKEVHDKGRTLKFTNQFVSENKPGDDKIIKDDTLAEGKEVYDRTPKSGYTYKLYKSIYQDGKLQEKVLVNTSTYRTVNGIKRVGTKKASSKSTDTKKED